MRVLLVISLSDCDWKNNSKVLFIAIIIIRVLRSVSSAAETLTNCWCLLNVLLDILLNVFLAIAVDNLGDAEEADEEAEKAAEEAAAAAAAAEKQAEDGVNVNLHQFS